MKWRSALGALHSSDGVLGAALEAGGPKSGLGQSDPTLRAEGKAPRIASPALRAPASHGMWASVDQIDRRDRAGPLRWERGHRGRRPDRRMRRMLPRYRGCRYGDSLRGL